MLKFVSETISLINHLDHDDRIGDQKLLDQGRCLDFWMSHEKDDHDLDFVDEWEEVEKLCDVV